MHCKSSFGSFADSPRRPRAMKPFQVGCCVFLGTSFPDILVRHCLPSTETLSLLTAHTSTGFKFYQRCSGTANRNHSKFHHTPGLKPSQTPTEDGNIQPWCSATLKEKILGGFLLQAFVFLEQSLQNSKLQVFVDLMDHRKVAADSPFQTHSTCP